MSPVGEILAQERLKQGISLSEVSRRTNIRHTFLTALEQGDFEALPPMAHSAGFVIAYAQLLGLDSHALAEQLREEMTGKRTQGRGAFDHARDTNRTSTDTHEIPWRMVSILAGIVVIAGLVIWVLTTFVFSKPSTTSPLKPRVSVETSSTIESTPTSKGGR